MRRLVRARIPRGERDVVLDVRHSMLNEGLFGLLHPAVLEQHVQATLAGQINVGAKEAG